MGGITTKFINGFRLFFLSGDFACDLNATAYMHSLYPKLARQEALMLNVFDVLVHTKRQMPIEAVKKGL